jgi:hypothetical protein
LVGTKPRRFPSPTSNPDTNPVGRMRFTSDQHSEMAKRLQERASKNTDPEKAMRQAALARVFRLLAARAEKQGANSG